MVGYKDNHRGALATADPARVLGQEKPAFPVRGGLSNAALREGRGG